MKQKYFIGDVVVFDDGELGVVSAVSEWGAHCEVSNFAGPCGKVRWVDSNAEVIDNLYGEPFKRCFNCKNWYCDDDRFPCMACKVRFEPV